MLNSSVQRASSVRELWRERITRGPARARLARRVSRRSAARRLTGVDVRFEPGAMRKSTEAAAEYMRKREHRESCDHLSVGGVYVLRGGRDVLGRGDLSRCEDVDAHPDCAGGA